MTTWAWTPRRGAADAIEWRLKLPLSLSYDHRLINGADAARFLRHVDESLASPRQLAAP
jgi:pyruvate dehydrogenase E2 component (dihydrolipoamide acetyltransferase)